MRQNFHYQGEEAPLTRESLMEEIRKTDQELELKRRQMELKKMEEDNIRKVNDSRRQVEHDSLR